MVVALACSAGGFSAVREVLAGLPAGFPAAIIVAQHREDSRAEVLVSLLAARTRMRVKLAEGLETMQAGWVYVCPPQMHIEVCRESLVRTWKGPRLNFVRPSCDLLFTSVAEVFGDRGVCVVLSGYGKDGAFATRNVHRASGFVIAQSEISSQHPDMPIAAVELGRVDLILALRDIPFALCRLVEAADAEEGCCSSRLDVA